MNKKGFGLVEILVVTVVLSVSLLMMFNSYSKMESGEQRKLCRDDIDLVFRLNYMKNYILDYIEIENFLFTNIAVKNSNASQTDDTLSVTLTNTSPILNASNLSNLFPELMKFNHIQTLYILKPDFNLISKCTKSVLAGNQGGLSTKEYNACINTFDDMDDETTQYIKNLGRNEFNNNYIIIAEYKDYHETAEAMENINNICKNARGLAWLDLGVPYE